MNNRYLFKAKRLDNGGWLYGFLAKMWGQLHIINPNDENTAYPIDESTICQCTGMKDKVGNLIWENDIVLWRDKRYAVKWYDSIGSFVIALPSGHWNHMEINYGDKLECFDYEVIGSAIDNPELLEVG